MILFLITHSITVHFLNVLRKSQMSVGEKSKFYANNLSQDYIY